jgi:hypothetical protein
MEEENAMIKAVMLYFGNNMMSSDSYPCSDFRERYKNDRRAKNFRIAETRHLFDYGLWKEATELMRRGRLNTVVVELSEGVIYPSHPELAVEGSWEPTRLQDELKRLRKMGLDPIPKLNFSTTHCAWQKQWRRLTSTPEYYRFCSDIIGDVCEIFEKPSHFHIGMDEEWETSQVYDPLVVLRHGDLWCHDCRYLINEVEKRGVRCAMWADWLRSHPDICQQHIPKSVLLHNWYYAELFNPAEFPPPPWSPIGYHSYRKLDDLGYDQCPTGSNWCGPRNMGMTVRHCLKTVSPKRLKGFMMAPWKRTLPENRDRILNGISQLIGALEAAGV